MPGDRDIDRRVAELVMWRQWRKPDDNRYTCQICGEIVGDCACGYSTKVEKAHAVIARMGELGWTWDVIGPLYEHDPIEVRFTMRLGEKRVKARDKSFPLAVCKAALAAMEAK